MSSMNISQYEVPLGPAMDGLHQAIYVTLTIVAMVTGVIGNTIILHVICIDHKFQTVGNEFIVNLAIADLLVTGVADPMCLVGK